MADTENQITRQDIQSAIAKAVELRALHAALTRGNSPVRMHFPSESRSPVSRHSPHLSAQDYPIFTPTYDDDSLPSYQQILLENRNYAESWGEHTLDENCLSDYTAMNTSARRRLPIDHVCQADDQHSVSGSCTNWAGPSPGPDFCKSRRNSMGDIKSVSSCNKCRPAIISSDSEGLTKRKSSNMVVPLTDSHSSLRSHPRNKGLGLSWLFPRLKKKNKNGNSPPRLDEASASMEMLKKELIEANDNKDAALAEVEGMKSSLGDLSHKLEYLETYCEELKMALRQAVQVKISHPAERLTSLPKQGKPGNGNSTNLIPVSEDVMMEGFLQIVSEARLSVKHFCKTLIGQIEETDHTLVENLNLLLQPYKLSLNSKYSKAIVYHLEAIINETLYQDFENCVFQKNGAPKYLDPQKDRQAKFQSFVSLRNLSWNEVLRKGTKYYSEEFSMFCDQKMGGIITSLGWTRPWPEQLLQAFFVAAKCVWLLHLLAFSFDRPLGILRVEENVCYEGNYMEDVFGERQRSGDGCGRVKVMVMPGFYVVDRVLKCKVVCRNKSAS